MKYNVVFVGVGGQGVLFSSKVIARAAFRKGLYVRTMHYKGMAQRGGSVKSFVRMGDVLAPTVPKAGADLVVSFELAETLNAYEYIDFDRTKVIVCDYKFPSLLNVLGKEKYPEELKEEFIALGFKVIDPMKELKEHGLPPVVMNSYLLGVVSKIEGFPLSADEIKEEIRASAKRMKEENEKAFDLGASAKLRQFFTLPF